MSVIKLCNERVRCNCGPDANVLLLCDRLTKYLDRFRFKRSSLFLYFWAMGFALLGSGCGSSAFRRSADKGAYGVIRDTQFQILGETNTFSIDTDYSDRKPEDITPAELIADRTQTNQHTLTIEDAINLAVENSRDYQDARENLFAVALNLSNTRYALGRSIRPESLTSADWIRDSDGHQSRSVTTENGVTVSQLFQTGGRLTVSALNSIMFYYSGRPELSFSSISAGFVQPLLNGFGRNNADVERLIQAERDLVYAVRSFRLYQDQFALRIVNDYFGLLQQQDSIRNRYTNYLGRVRATQRLEARAEDRERLADVDQARQAELNSRNNYVDAVARYRTSLDQFKITLGLPVGHRVYLDDQALTALEDTGLVPAPLDSSAAFDLALRRQLQMLTYIDQFEDRKRKARVAANRLKPGLNLFVSSSLRTEDTDYLRFDPDKARAGAGLQLDLPLDRLPRGNTYRAALLDFEFGLRTFTARLDALKISIENGIRTLEQRRQNYEIQKNALVLADRRVLSANLLLEAGRSEVRNLIEAQDAQIASQTAVTSALLAYQEARLRLMLDIGALNADLPQFWLQNHLASFLPASASVPILRSADDAVPPPEESFQN
jgi:outer membrane protein TolC